MFFLNLLKTFSSEHRQTTLFPHSYFIHVCDTFMNIHHYNKKYIGLCTTVWEQTQLPPAEQTIQMGQVALQQPRACCSSGPTAAQGPLQPRAHCSPGPIAAQGSLQPRAHGGQEGGFHLFPPGRPSRGSAAAVSWGVTWLFCSLLSWLYLWPGM